jgi:hypothetical protein
MGYKMKGMSFLDGQSPMKKIKASDKKTIAGEDTDIIKTNKKGKDYALSMFDQESGINKGDTLFAPKNKIPSVYGYVMGGEKYDATETKDSKKRKKGPKSYTLSTQPAPTKMKGKTKEQLLKEGFTPADADRMIKDGATTGEVKAKKSKTSAHGQMNDAKEEYKQDKKMLANKKRKAKAKAKALKVTANQGDFKPAYAGADISASEYKKRMKNKRKK